MKKLLLIFFLGLFSLSVFAEMVTTDCIGKNDDVLDQTTTIIPSGTNDQTNNGSGGSVVK